ncbi:hypothetical protein EV426DRAFT_709408 [Tirmania nivea]|nr:hypothetical protein EV426DRAFT_709408 [Tirmania nivea]
MMRTSLEGRADDILSRRGSAGRITNEASGLALDDYYKQRYGLDEQRGLREGCANQTNDKVCLATKQVATGCEDGYHITFDCPRHSQQRQDLIGDASTWEGLDTPIWRKEEGEKEEWDAVEAYFAYLYPPLAGR